MKHGARFIITARLLLDLLSAGAALALFVCSHFRMVDRALRRLLLLQLLFFDIIISSAIAAAGGEYSSLQLSSLPLPSLQL